MSCNININQGYMLTSFDVRYSFLIITMMMFVYSIQMKSWYICTRINAILNKSTFNVPAL